MRHLHSHHAVREVGMSGACDIANVRAKDNKTGIKIGPSHMELTEADKRQFDLHFDRLKASQERQLGIR